MKFFAAIVLATISAASAQLTCPTTGTINIAGSSTVEPIALAWATQYKVECPGVTVNVAGGGSSIGARRVCGNPAGGTPVEIGTMSREWRSSEATVTDKSQEKYTCVAPGLPARTVTQIDVAIDGVSVVLQNAGLAGTCVAALGGLTMDQLRWIYTNYTTVQLNATGWDATSLARDDNNETSHNWSEIDPRCPIAEVKLSSPGTLSGTFDYFREQVFNASGPEGMATRRPGNPTLFSEDDNVLVNFVSFSSAQTFGDGISYFGFSYYINDAQILYGVPIKARGATTFVEPTRATVEGGTYLPLSRRIYMNVLDSSLATTGPFISFGLNQKGINLVKKAGYVQVPSAELPDILKRIGREAPEPIVPTAPPKVAPVPVPAGTPVAPVAPVRAPTPTGTGPKPCGLFGLSIFCPFTFCGILGRLLGLCRS